VSEKATVYILTYCREMELFYGTEMVFKSLRTGFPNARVTVVDNSSLPEAAVRIEALARQTDCAYECVSDRVPHHEFIEERIRITANDSRVRGPVVFLDPDICFWKSCEDFDFDGILAGRLEGAFYTKATRTYTMPRIHTSFMWIPDVAELCREVAGIRAGHFDFVPLRSVSMKIAGQWYRFDTGGSLYAAMPGKMSSFTEEHLDCYDHLYGGCHVDWVFPITHSRAQELLARTHAHAKAGDFEALKGMWRIQDAVANGKSISQFLVKEKEESWTKRDVTMS